jgi:aspartyl-tRNA(Asn)/glutamyl-tRNA(Gln) amidotransferase subunit A
VKDLFDTAGVRTTYGSAVFSDYVPSASAPWIVELEARGWVNVGKVNLYEFALGTTSHNLHYGDVPNPRFPGLTAGGSSGGSAAAVALGEADVALGTDTGGSIRIPAACCGIVGFKPTFGLVSTDGVFPCAPSFDHAGPMARDVAGCIELLGLNAPEVALSDLSVGLAWGVEVPVRGMPIDFPLAGDVEPAADREVGDVHRELYAEQGELYGENVREYLEGALAVTDAENEAAMRARSLLVDRAGSALDGFDVLLTPTLAGPVPAADVPEEEVYEAMSRFTFPFNALGWPALAIGGVQLVGRAGADALVLGAGLALEAALAS